MEANDHSSLFNSTENQPRQLQWLGDHCCLMVEPPFEVTLICRACWTMKIPQDVSEEAEWCVWKASGKETKVAEPINYLSCLDSQKPRAVIISHLEILRHHLGAALGICANKRNTVLFLSDLNSPRWICEQLINGRIKLLITEGKQVYLWGLSLVN